MSSSFITAPLSRTSNHLVVGTASGAQKSKLSLQMHSSVRMLSFVTEVGELNIATRADTMMAALSSLALLWSVITVKIRSVNSRLVGITMRSVSNIMRLLSVRERVWLTAIELPVLAYPGVSVNWFEVSRQPGRFDRQILMRFIILRLTSNQLTLTLPRVKARTGSSMAVGQTLSLLTRNKKGKGRLRETSSISTKIVFHNKRQSLVAEALPVSSGQTDKNITPF